MNFRKKHEIKEGTAAKMKTAAVICEYNPMHRGHIGMIRCIREYMEDECTVLCLMSGDFVQRGEPSVYDKYERARVAVENGADLVLELPYPWSASVGEYFANGAVSLLNRFCAVDALFFGSEKRNERELFEISKRLSDVEFQKYCKVVRASEKNLSFPRLRDRCYAGFYGEVLQLSPNEILGMYYLSSLSKTHSKIAAHALPLTAGFSASGERKNLRGKPMTAFFENASSSILTVLRLREGTDRFSQAARNCATLEELFNAVRCPSDTDARLRRELLGSVLRLSARALELPPEFTVLLASNAKGRILLSKIKRCGDISVVTKQAKVPKNETAAKQYVLYLRAQNFYASFLEEPVPSDYLIKKCPYILP